MPKKEKPKSCAWCGTAFRNDGTSCPRGPQCAREQAEHEEMALRVGESERQDKAKASR